MATKGKGSAKINPGKYGGYVTGDYWGYNPRNSEPNDKLFSKYRKNLKIDRPVAQGK